MSFCCILPSRCSSTVFPFARARPNGNGSEAPRLHVQDAWHHIRHTDVAHVARRVARVARLCSPHCWAQRKPWIRVESRRCICTLQSRRRSPTVLRTPTPAIASAPNIVNSPSPAPHIPAMAPKRSVFRSNTPTWSAPYGVKYATSL